MYLVRYLYLSYVYPFKGFVHACKISACILIFLILCTISAKNTQSQSVEVFDFNGFEQHIEQQTSQILVINFWATWCRPCVKEMPVFQKITNDYNHDTVKVILVSLDFENHLEDRVIPFIRNREIQSEVVLLDDTDYNSWIDKIDTNWQGEIPFTWVKDNRNNMNFFHYGEITIEQITNTIHSLIKINSHENNN